MSCQEEDTDQRYKNDVGVSDLYQINGRYLHWICQFSEWTDLPQIYLQSLAPGLVGLNKISRDQTPR